VLLHLVDGTSDDVAADYETIITELENYAGALADKPRVTALNKIDALDDDEQAERRAELEKLTGGTVHLMSGVAGDGVQNVLRALRAEIDADRLREKASTEEPEPWRP